MKHAEILTAPKKAGADKRIEAGLADGRKVYLTEREYTREELYTFESEKANWILKRSGTRQFTADSDSGEDATGYYCHYFDLVPENAVFDRGRFVGFSIRPGYMEYSGNGRASFEIEDWGYPGDALFTSSSWATAACVFLFADAGTHQYKEWTLQKRDPDKEYKSCLEF